MSSSSSWLKALTGDTGVSDRLGDAAQIAEMLRIEALYARVAGQVGKVSAKLGQAAAEAIADVQIDHARLCKDAVRDGVPVPGLVAQIKEQVADGLHPAVHSGLTSQDVTDTVFILAVRDILESFDELIKAVVAECDRLKAKFGDLGLMGRTRMQAALPIKAAHRISQWRAPFDDHLTRLDQLRPRLLTLQLAGPVGTGESFEGFADEIAGLMAKELGLGLSQTPWHTRRDNLAELANWAALVTGGLGKIGSDLSLMAQQGINEVALVGGGTSSAMTHKSNPVEAEVLVALARDTALQQAGMTLALEHEQERSGTAWTLEWLVLPRLLENTGAALRIAQMLLGRIERLGS